MPTRHKQVSTHRGQEGMLSTRGPQGIEFILEATTMSQKTVDKEVKLELIKVTTMNL